MIRTKKISVRTRSTSIKINKDVITIRSKTKESTTTFQITVTNLSFYHPTFISHLHAEVYLEIYSRIALGSENFYLGQVSDFIDKNKQTIEKTTKIAALLQNEGVICVLKIIQPHNSKLLGIAKNLKCQSMMQPKSILHINWCDEIRTIFELDWNQRPDYPILKIAKTLKTHKDKLEKVIITAAFREILMGLLLNCSDDNLEDMENNDWITTIRQYTKYKNDQENGNIMLLKDIANKERIDIQNDIDKIIEQFSVKFNFLHKQNKILK